MIDQNIVEITAQVETGLEKYDQIVIVNDNDFVICTQDLKTLKSKLDIIDDFFDPQIAKAHELHKEILAKKKSLADKIRSAYDKVQQALSGYQTKKRLEAEQKEKERRQRLAVVQEVAQERMYTAKDTLKNDIEFDYVAWIKGDLIHPEWDKEQRELYDKLAGENILWLGKVKAGLIAEAELKKQRKEDQSLFPPVETPKAEEAPPAPVIVIEEKKPGYVKTEGTRTVEDFEVFVVDASLVPYEVDGVVLHKIDEGAVKRLVKLQKGKKEIPGVRIEKTTRVEVTGR